MWSVECTEGCTESVTYWDDVILSFIPSPQLVPVWGQYLWECCGVLFFTTGSDLISVSQCPADWVSGRVSLHSQFPKSPQLSPSPLPPPPPHVLRWTWEWGRSSGLFNTSQSVSTLLCFSLPSKFKGFSVASTNIFNLGGFPPFLILGFKYCHAMVKLSGL